MSRFTTLGILDMTCGVANLIEDSPDFQNFVWNCYNRYIRCDWGDLCAVDSKQNDEAVRIGENRIFASYECPEHNEWKIWIITERDRSTITILFPSEY